MSFISTYFADYNEYKDYYGKYADTYYHYVLKAYGTTELLKINPAGGDEINIKYLRHEFYDSIFRSFALSLKFFRKEGGGGQFILSAYDGYDIAAIIEVEIWFRNHVTFDYELLYSGLLDLKPEKLSISRDFVECGIIDNSKLDKFISRDELRLDISQRKSVDDVTVPEFSNYNGVDVRLTPVNIYNEAHVKLQCVQDVVLPEDGSAFDLFFTAKEITSNPIPSRFNVESVESVTGTTPSSEAIETLYENNLNSNCDVVVTISNVTNLNRFKTNYLPATFFAFTIENILITVDEDDNELYFTRSTVTCDGNGATWISLFYNKYFDLDFSNFENLSLTIKPGEKLIFKTIFTPLEFSALTGEYQAWTYSQNVYFDLVFYEKSIGQPSSTYKHYFAHDVLSRLIQLTTSETDTDKLHRSTIIGREPGVTTNMLGCNFQSYTETGEAGHLAFTVGKALRKFPDYEMYFSVRDFIQFMKSAYNTGFGYDINNDRFYLERIETFYDESFTMFELHNVSNFEIRPYSQAYYNEIKAGYKENSEESIQGAREFNDARTYSTRSTVKSSYDLRSPIIAGSTYIEGIRRYPYSRYPLEDRSNDNENFVVETEFYTASSPYRYQAKLLGTSAGGFDGVDEYYNFDLTPRKNLVRNLTRLRPQLWKSPEAIKLSEKQNSNYSLNYQDDDSSAYDNYYSDFADIDKDDYEGVEIFQPKIISVEGTLTANDIVTLNNNPHGIVYFDYEDERYEGFLISLETEGNTRYNLKVKVEIVTKEISGNNYIFEDNNNYIFEDDENHIFE